MLGASFALPVAAAPTELEYWTTQTQSDRMATIQVLIDTFTAMNPDITIKLIPIDENATPTQLVAAAAAGTLPALVETGVENAVAFGAEGYFDTKASTDIVKSIGKDRFYQGVLNLVDNGKGSYVALPYHGWIQGIWYRDDWFKKAGLAPPNTWDNILKAAKYFYKPERNQYGILVGTKTEVYSEQCFTPIAMSNGAGLFNGKGQLVFNSPAMKEAVNFYAELAKYNPPGPQTWRARDYYLQGKLAMMFYSTYIMDDLALASAAANSLGTANFKDLQGAQFDPDLVKHTEFAPIISHKTQAGYGTLYTLAFGKQKDPAATAAAEKFVRFLYTPSAYIAFLHMAPGGMNPALREIATNPKFLDDPQGIFKFYGAAKMAEIIEGLDKVKTFGIVDGRRIPAAGKIFAKQIIPQMLYSITQEDVPVDVAMKKAEADMRAIMAQ
ncbi:MAG TPA: extracellular solute-binding protein [Rectinemataceae bacterium]|nr:extracellular solute-binding protein [Rectinemataceae bacterium]